MIELVNSGLITMCGNKDHYRRPPPLSRLWTGTVGLQTVAELYYYDRVRTYWV